MGERAVGDLFGDYRGDLLVPWQSSGRERRSAAVIVTRVPMYSTRSVSIPGRRSHTHSCSVGTPIRRSEIVRANYNIAAYKVT